MSHASKLPSFDDGTDIDRAPIIMCDDKALPGNVQEVLFYIAFCQNDKFYPMAVASQMPPTGALWQDLPKGFVVETVRKMYAYLSNKSNHAMLAEEVWDARTLNYHQVFERLFGPVQPPGVSGEEELAIWLDNPAFPHAARALMDNLDGDFWATVGLNTTMGMFDKRYRAVVFDVTDLDNVACGIVETKMVKTTNDFTGAKEENMWRAVVTVPEWEAMETGFEDIQGKRDDSAAHHMADFPAIPLIDDKVQLMLWDKNHLSSDKVSEAQNKVFEAESKEG
ncbi:hypothetical protein MY10362_006114 [Beauveria mimosiformis]